MIKSVFDLANKFMDSPRYVEINTKKAAEVAKQITCINGFATDSSDLARVVEYELMAAAINYCYWYGRNDVRPTGGGATEMYRALDETWAEYPDDIHASARFIYFKNKLVTGRYPLLEARLKHLTEVRDSLEFVSILCEDIERPTFQIETHITNLCVFMPGFGSDMFLKRACLFFMMLHRRTGVLPESQLRLLPIPADYQVPKMLEWLGVLEYSDGLRFLIESHAPIPAGSLMECEIRAASILACEMLAGLSGETMCDVDDYLWSRRKSCDRPFHLTVTTDY